MGSSSDLRSALDRLAAGTKVRLELADGSVVEGRVKDVAGDVVTMQNADSVATGDLADIVIVRESDGPE